MLSLAFAEAFLISGTLRYHLANASKWSNPAILIKIAANW